MNRTKSILFIAVFSIIAIIYFNTFEFGDTSSSVQDGVTKTELESKNDPQYLGENLNSPVVSELEKVSDTTTIASDTHQEESKNPKTVRTMEYNDAWCTESQLSPKDREFAQNEIKDWEATVGRLTPSHYSEEGYIANYEDHITQPYLNLDKQALRKFVREEDPSAMFAALDRRDFSLKERYDIARNLLVHGYTGKPINILVIQELIYSEANYEKNKLSEKTLKHLRNAMVYAAYSLNMHDATGFTQLAFKIESSPVLEVELNPAVVFSKEEFVDIAAEAEELHNSIKSLREEKGLPSIDRELTKIAKHLLDRDIGTLHGLQPLTMQLLAEKNGDVFPVLESNDCKRSYARMFAKN